MSIWQAKVTKPSPAELSKLSQDAMTQIKAVKNVLKM